VVHTALNAAADNVFAFPCIGHTAIIHDVDVVDKGMMGKVAVMVKVLFTNCLNICTKMVRKWTTAFMKLIDDDKTHVVDAIGDGKKKKEGSGLTPQTRSNHARHNGSSVDKLWSYNFVDCCRKTISLMVLLQTMVQR